MPEISPTLMFTFAISAVFAAIVLWRSKQGKKAKQITALVFRKSGIIDRVQAEAKYGVAHLRDGGYMIRPGGMVFNRSGRPWAKSKTLTHLAQLRNRSELLMVREGDPSPMDLSVGDLVGPVVTSGDTKAIENQSHRLASVQAVIDGDPGDVMAQRLTLAVLFSVVAAIAAWGALFAVQIMQGPTV